jgi:hypothetical protein
MSRRRRGVSAFLLFTFLFGCTSWHPEPVTPQEFFTGKAPLSVRLTLTSGSLLEVDSARVRGDSVIGIASRRPVQVALVDIRHVATSRTGTGESVGLVLGIGAGILALAAVIAAASYDGPFSSGCSVGSGQ